MCPVAVSKVTSGGLAVSQAPAGYGLPCLLGQGQAITVVASGGLPIADAGTGIFGPVLWLPSQLATLKLWLKGDSNTGADGSVITTWADQSGLGNNATAVNGPTVKAANLNGLNTVQFTAVSQQYFTLPNMLSGFTAGSVIFVVKLLSDPPASNLTDSGVTKFGADTSLNGNNNYAWKGDNVIYDDFGSTTRTTIGDPATNLAAWHMSSFHAASNDKRMYINATSFFTTASNSVGWRSPQPMIGKGARTGGGENYLDGWLAELIFVNEALSTSDRQKLEGYLAYKWGLQSVLPGGHPYKSTPP